MEGLLTTLLVIVGLFIISGIKIVKQYEEGVVLTLGKFTGIRKPGLRVVIPIFQTIMKVDMRLTTVDIPRQEVITKDNVTINVDAVVYFKVAKADIATLEVQNYRLATAQYAQASLRDVVGKVELDTLLSERDQISHEIKTIVDEATEPWGIDVPTVNIQNVELPQDMKRVIGKQAEAEREKRSVIVKAQGELQASQNLADAAKTLASTPGALHLRTLATLNDLSSDQSNTVVFAVPLEILRAFESIADGNGVVTAINKATKHSSH